MLRTALLLLYLPVAANAQSLAMSCHSIRLNGDLASGNHFEKAISQDLVFRLEPERLGNEGNVNGWRMSLVPLQDSTRDYIYPVNPPLRFNGLQILGPSYGEDTRTSLGHARYAYFIWSAADYDRIWPLMTNALWPYSAPDPDKAVDEYVSALNTVTTGQLKLTVQTYDADPVTGSIRHLGFQVEFTAPEDLRFDAALKPKPAACRETRRLRVG
jgi:hypothetical protein